MTDVTRGEGGPCQTRRRGQRVFDIVRHPSLTFDLHLASCILHPKDPNHTFSRLTMALPIPGTIALSSLAYLSIGHRLPFVYVLYQGRSIYPVLLFANLSF
jgi:hypothetical protein